MSPLEAGGYYLSLGWNIIPVVPHTKRALVHWKQFQEEFVTLELLREWHKTYPNANIAIITGQISDLVVIDVDGEMGQETLKKYPLPQGPRVKTRKGEHSYFVHPGIRVRNLVRVLPGIDIRGDGGMAVAPPSIYSHGVYRWIEKPGGKLPSLPQWCIEAITPKIRPPLIHIPKGTDYAEGVLRNEIQKLATTQEGCRNDQLNRAAFVLGTLVRDNKLSEFVVTAALQSAARACGLEENETKGTIESGLEAGKRQ